MKKFRSLFLIIASAAIVAVMAFFSVSPMSFAASGFTAVANFLKKSGNNLYLYSTNYRLGLGTTTPATRLGVTGTASLDPFDVSSSSGVSLVRITQAGNVGINTSSPSGTLTVVNSSTSTTQDLFVIGSSTAPSLSRFDYQGFLYTPHLIGQGSAPAVATSTGVGAGSGSTVSNSGTDLDGFVNFFTTNAPAAGVTAVQLTFSKAFASAPKCNITSATSSATFYSSVWATTTTTTLLLKSTTTALVATSSYAFYYSCQQ